MGRRSTGGWIESDKGLVTFVDIVYSTLSVVYIAKCEMDGYISEDVMLLQCFVLLTHNMKVLDSDPCFVFACSAHACVVFSEYSGCLLQSKNKHIRLTGHCNADLDYGDADLVMLKSLYLVSG